MSYKSVIKKVSKELNIPEDEVDFIYKSFWQYIKNTIESLPLKEDLSKEEFDKLRTNFNIPHLGKLSCTYKRMLGVKKRFNLLKNKKNAKD